MGPFNDLGPCIVSFDGVDIGPTNGDVVFKYNPESKPVKEDQQGVTEVDGIFVGVSDCSVEVPMSRSTLANLATVIPGASKGNTYLQVNSKGLVGKSRYDLAKVLILKPIENGVAAEQSKWLTIHKASPSAALEVTFNNESQRIFKVVFKAFPDATTGNLWKIG